MFFGKPRTTLPLTFFERKKEEGNDEIKRNKGNESKTKKEKGGGKGRKCEINKGRNLICKINHFFIREIIDFL